MVQKQAWSIKNYGYVGDVSKTKQSDTLLNNLSETFANLRSNRMKLNAEK
jgi:hypothetical protein